MALGGVVNCFPNQLYTDMLTCTSHRGTQVTSLFPNCPEQFVQQFRRSSDTRLQFYHLGMGSDHNLRSPDPEFAF